MTCPGYPETVALAPRELIRLDDARGTSLRVTRGTLWITQDQDSRDIVLSAGDTWTVERDGLTLVEAQQDAIVCLVGPAANPARMRVQRRALGAFARHVDGLLAGGARRFVPYF